MSTEALRSSIHAPIGFSFRKRWGTIDWKNLASIDVDKITQKMDIQALQSNIMNITFCNVDSEDFHNLDTSFIKLFRLAQLTIEYLLHSQQYLSDHGTQLEEKVEAVQQDLIRTQEQLSIKTGEIKSLKKENRKRRKVIEAYQDLINLGATGVHTCPDCSREFVTVEYLQSHMHRRHPDHLSTESKDVKSNFNLQCDVLEKRLMEQMMEHLKVSEEHFKDHLEKKLTMQEFKEPILEELKSLRQEKAGLEEALQQTQAELSSMKTKKLSSLGQLEDAEILAHSDSKQLSEKSISQVKEDLETQVQEVHTALKKQEEIWKRRLLKLGATYQDQIKDSMDKLQALEHSLLEFAREKDSGQHQALLSHQLESFHQKLRQHEKQLHSQQKQLFSLQSHEPLPANGGTSATSPSGLNMLVDREAKLETSSDADESDTTSVDKEEVDSLSYVHQIKTLRVHQPELLESIKRESQMILSNSLVQRGFQKNAMGITTYQLEEKMKTLNQERQQRVNTHYKFADIRDKVNEKVDALAENYTLGCPKNTASKPPKPTITEPSTVIPDPFASEVTAKEALMVESKTSYKFAEALPSGISQSLELDTQSNVPNEGAGHIVYCDKQDGTEVSDTIRREKDFTTHELSDESPWDSEDNSVDEQFATGGSSTPLKNESDDSLDISEVSNPLSTEKSQRITKSSDTHAKQVSQTATSYSVLTVVSNNLEDSELSDSLDH